MKDKIIVIFDANTKEIIACIPLNGQNAICKNGVDFNIYNGTEPIFTNTDNGIVLNETAFIMSMEQ